MSKKKKNNNNNNRTQAPNSVPVVPAVTVAPVVQTNSNNNVSKENTMAKTYTEAEMQAIVAQATASNSNSSLDCYAEQAKEQRKNKTINKSEITLLKKEIALGKQHINDKELLALKDAGTKIEALKIKQDANFELVSLKESYKPQLKALRIDFEAIMPATATEAGEWFGEKAAPIVKTVGSFFGAAATRAGITMPWNR